MLITCSLVCQRDSWSPLQASKDMIMTLADYHELGPAFLDVLSLFRDRYVATEEAFSGSARSDFTSDRAGM